MPPKVRIIARLDVKSDNVVKGVHLEGLRVVGKPHDMALRYVRGGIDELIHIDSVASLYGRNSLLKIVEETAKSVDIPLTVGGGVRSLDDLRNLLGTGADKVAINTAALRNPLLVKEAAQAFGSQCVVLSIAAKKKGPGKWVAYTDNGREATDVDVLAWAEEGCRLGAGEILITSIDKEGTSEGFDLELVGAIARRVTVPVMASGGAGSVADVVALAKTAEVGGICLASLLHYNKADVAGLKEELKKAGIPVRQSFTGEVPRGGGTAGRVGVVDVGVGNLFNVLKAVRAFSGDVAVVRAPADLAACERLVLPGVGSFSHAMAQMRERGLTQPIKDFAASGKPVLGICLGAQLLFDRSEEFGPAEGLGLIAGEVVSLARENAAKASIPHIGWSALEPAGGGLLSGVSPADDFYFVHSFKMVPADRRCLAAVTRYGGQEVAAVVVQGAVAGCQFHPERSGAPGMRLIMNFLAAGKLNSPGVHA